MAKNSFCLFPFLTRRLLYVKESPLRIGRKRAALTLLGLGLFSALVFKIIKTDPPTAQPSLFLPDGTRFSLEIAATPAERENGLMFRQDLCRTCGMLFIFPREGIYPFWNKSTFLSLDLIFLDSNGRLVEIFKRTKSYRSESDLKTYRPLEPSRFVLEILGGSAQAHDLKIGDRIKLPPELDKDRTVM